jgi:hypothetical protein
MSKEYVKNPDGTLGVAETKVEVVSVDYKLKDLKRERRNLVEDKQNYVDAINLKIAELDALIAKCVELDIKEPVEE